MLILYELYSNVKQYFEETPTKLHTKKNYKIIVVPFANKTTITVYNSVNSDYVREATGRLNTRIQEQQKEKEVEIEQTKEPELTDEEIDRMIRELERKKKRKEKDFEM